MTDLDRISRRVWETMGKAKGKLETKWAVVEHRKDWTVMKIRVERNKHLGNKYTPTNIPELNNRKGTGNKIEQHQWGRY